MHPLTPDLSQLSLDELQSKYNDLLKRYNQAHQMGSAQLTGQIIMLIEDYQSEIRNRQQKLLDEINNKNNNFKNIIDIK
jgi:hypothetical protein